MFDAYELQSEDQVWFTDDAKLYFGSGNTLSAPTHYSFRVAQPRRNGTILLECVEFPSAGPYMTWAPAAGAWIMKVNRGGRTVYPQHKVRPPLEVGDLVHVTPFGAVKVLLPGDQGTTVTALAHVGNGKAYRLLANYDAPDSGLIANRKNILKVTRKGEVIWQKGD